jgi:hypothetical protein
MTNKFNYVVFPEKPITDDYPRGPNDYDIDADWCSQFMDLTSAETYALNLREALSAHVVVAKVVKRYELEI